MSEDRVVELRHPGSFSEDPLTSVLRSGARRLLAQAVEMEVTAFIAAHGDLEDDAGRRRVVRHGHHRERQVQTGIGPVAVRCPRVRDRGGSGEAGKIRFTSAILPPYLRRAKSIEELLPWLYLKGISTGDFTEALAALLGPDAPGLSASTITRLKDVWQGELARWEKRDLSARRYLYFWADGIYFQPRMEHDKQCILVIIGADQWGRKELLAIADGYRESAQSWRELLLDLKRRGLEVAPELAVGDGALGFWKALRESHGTTREQRCWLHKTGNVLNKLPKSLQAKAKGHLQDIWLAETKDRAEKAFDFFLEAYGAKYDKATACLAKEPALMRASMIKPSAKLSSKKCTAAPYRAGAAVCESECLLYRFWLQPVPRPQYIWWLSLVAIYGRLHVGAARRVDRLHPAAVSSEPESWEILYWRR